MVSRPAARLTRNFIFRVAVPRLTGLAYYSGRVEKRRL